MARNPPIVAKGLTWEAADLPTFADVRHRGHPLQHTDWIIDLHEHPAFGKSAFEFARTEARQPWVACGICLLCGKDAQASHCACERHAKKLTEEFDPMDTLCKGEYKHLIEGFPRPEKEFKTKFIEGLLARGWTDQEIRDRQSTPNELRDYLVMSPSQMEGSARSDAGSAAGESMATASEGEPPAQRHCGPRRQFESGPVLQRMSAPGPMALDPRLSQVMSTVEQHSGMIRQLHRVVRALMEWASDPATGSNSAAETPQLPPAGSCHPQQPQLPPAGSCHPPQPPPAQPQRLQGGAQAKSCQSAVPRIRLLPAVWQTGTYFAFLIEGPFPSHWIRQCHAEWLIRCALPTLWSLGALSSSTRRRCPVLAWCVLRGLWIVDCGGLP